MDKILENIINVNEKIIQARKLLGVNTIFDEKIQETINELIVTNLDELVKRYIKEFKIYKKEQQIDNYKKSNNMKGICRVAGHTYGKYIYYSSGIQTVRKYRYRECTRCKDQTLSKIVKNSLKENIY